MFPKPVKAKKAKKRPRRQRKTTQAALGRIADKLWSQIVKLPGRSYISGETQNLQAAHGISRRYRGTRWLLINGFPLTAAEHLKYTYDPLAWDDLLREWWGLDVYQEMRRLAYRTTEDLDLPKIIQELRAELEKRTSAGE